MSAANKVALLSAIAVAALGVGSLMSTAAFSQSKPEAAQSAEQTAASLDICRAKAAMLDKQLSECAFSSPIVQQARERRDATYFDQQVRLQDIRVRAFEWQIFAANCVLALVAFLSISGILFAGYQLWTAAKIATVANASTELELSTEKVRLQSNIVGIVVLVISGVFLLLFLRNVYQFDESGSSTVPHERSESGTKVPH